MEPAIPQPPTPYRKLPGRLRGFGYVARVWMAPDHLLLVRTRMFREEYKRFYLRDIQAIVMATRPRFLISTRSLAIAFAWLFPWVFWIILPAGFGIAWWAVAAILAGAWLVFSFFFSCTCRLYTAVSNDPLPSVSTAIGWILSCLVLVQVASAILVMVQRQRRILRAPMQRVAIAALLTQGLIYYVAATSAAFVNPGGNVAAGAFSRLVLPQFILLREIAAAIYVVLALIGLAINASTT